MNITEFGNGRYLSSDDQVLRIINTNRNSEGNRKLINYSQTLTILFLQESSHAQVLIDLDKYRKALVLKLTFQFNILLGQNGRNVVNFVEQMKLNFVLELVFYLMKFHPTTVPETLLKSENVMTFHVQ